MEKTFTLANKTFSLSTESEDSERRGRYFEDPTSGAVLKPNEQAILTALGIDKEMQRTLRTYLKEFFDELPSCTTDATLRLSKRCEIPYYVIWNIEFANHAQTVKRVDNYPNNETRKQLQMAVDDSLLYEFKNISVEGAKYDKLFTLAPVLGERKKTSVEMVKAQDPYESLFTLQAV